MSGNHQAALGRRRPGVARRLPELGPQRPPRRTPALATLLSVVLVAACGSSAPTQPITSVPPTPTAAPSASPSGVAASGSPAASGAVTSDLAAAARAIEGQVVAIRGLPQKAPVDPKVLDAAGMKAYIEADFTKENPADVLAANERLAKTLGLLPADASLGGLEEQLLSSQVVGLYSPDDKALYVLQSSASLGPSERMIFAHEFTHALQDQSFDLVKYGQVSDDPHQGDRALARLSLVEGDASTVMAIWAQSNLTVQELLQAAQDAADPAAMAILTAMPAYLRETSLFPYTAGETFVLGLEQAGGWDAVDAAFAAPPETTEQVMHSAKWAAHEKAIPVAVPDGLAGRMGSGWSVGTEDTLGELQLQVWLRGSDGTPSTAAATAAAGWGGDRVALLDGPNGAHAVALLTAWDSATDAQEFADQAKVAIASYKLSAEVVYQPGATTARVLVGSDADIAARLQQAMPGG